jgi:hypothetical protein
LQAKYNDIAAMWLLGNVLLYKLRTYDAREDDQKGKGQYFTHKFLHSPTLHTNLDWGASSEDVISATQDMG